MDHLHAKQSNAVERYLLGELAPAEAEDFELHYFECPQCALAVETGQSFITHARAHFREPETPKAAKVPDRPSFLEALAALWRRPAFALSVMAILAAIAIYQGAVVIPSLHRVLNTARSLPAVLLIGASRGDAITVPLPADSPFLSLAADIPPSASFQQYECVLTRGGNPIASSISPAPAEGQPVTILIPAGELRNGSHELTLYGVGADGRRSDKISTYPFSVHFN